VLGSITHPEVVIAGLYTTDGELVTIGRTVALKPEQSARLAAVLTPARRGHPWPDEITSYRWGGPDSTKPLVKVEPAAVAEVTADAATQAGRGGTGCATCGCGPMTCPCFGRSWRRLIGRGSWKGGDRRGNRRAVRAATRAVRRRHPETPRHRATATERAGTLSPAPVRVRLGAWQPIRTKNRANSPSIHCSGSPG